MPAIDKLNFENIDDLFGYQPNEPQYIRYGVENPNIIATGYKVGDVYQTLSRARAMLSYTHMDDWGDLAPKDDDFSILFAKSQMVLSALLLYGITLDMSWQMAWAYVQPASKDFLLDREYLNKYKDCTLDNIIAQLNCSISHGGLGVSIAEQLRDMLLEFNGKLEVERLRSMYNSMKHHGNFHVVGLGMNDQELCFSVNGVKVPALNRHSYTIEELEEVILAYDQEFVPYIRSMVSLLIPADYKNSKLSLDEFISGALDLKR